MKEKRRIEGDMACDAGFLVLPECLDRTFESRTACFPLTVMLPRLDQEQDTYNLLAPFSPSRAAQDSAEAAEARYAGDSVWGCVNAWRDPEDWNNPPIPTSAVVQRLRFSTEGAAGDDDELQNTLHHFGRDQKEWWKRLADWIGVVSSQDLVGLGKHRRTNSIDHVSIWIADAERDHTPGLTKLDFGDLRPYCGDPLTEAQLSRCMTLTGETLRPPEAWLLIRDARSLVRDGEYRRAVLDAGIAAELALTSMLDDYLSTRSSPEVADALMQGTRMLGPLHKLAKRLLPGTLPAQFTEDVIEPRNRASHGGGELTKEDAEIAIGTTTDVLLAAHPLYQFGI